MIEVIQIIETEEEDHLQMVTLNPVGIALLKIFHSKTET